MIKHFDTGRFNLMPMSGRHTITACGISLQDSYKKDADRKTKKLELVTCKNCKKRLQKENLKCVD